MGTVSQDYLSSTEKMEVQLPSQYSMYSSEDIHYCIEQEETLRKLEISLTKNDDPVIVSKLAMKAACDFYSADWAGIFIVDFSVNIWRPYWWYNPNPDRHMDKRVLECESTEYLERWGKAMKDNQPISIPDTSIIRNEYPSEYEIYLRMKAKSLLAIPFKPRPLGFFVLRNPKRYMDRSGTLRYLTYVGMLALKEQMFLESKKYVCSPDDIKSEKELVINVFDGLEIHSSKGVLREDDIKSPRMCRLLIYLLINKRISYSPRKLAEDIWSEGDLDTEVISKNIRGLIYRFRQVFSLISSYPLIESTSNGYRLNPELHIMTDLESFNAARKRVQAVHGTAQKVEQIKKALAIYKGEIFPSGRGEHWLAATANSYSFRYIGLAHELLSKLADAEEWESVYYYATKAVSILPGNVKGYFWLIVGMYKSGAVESAIHEVEHARSALLPEEFAELEKWLSDAANYNTVHINIFQRKL